MKRIHLSTVILAFCFTLFGSPITANAETHLLMIGGGSRPSEALAEFVKAAGGVYANIVVAPWASATSDGAKNIQSELLALHAGSVTVLPMLSKQNKRIQTGARHIRKSIETATAIFFAGGDQTRLMNALFTLKLKPILQKKYKSGVVFGGTSAGTAIMSERMMTGDQTPLAVGLGLLPPAIIVDQHFIVRQRFDRLRQWVEKYDNTYGIGIDENTALWVTNNQTATVIGPSQVVYFEKNSLGQVRTKLYQPHESFSVHRN